jgi:hypothetical protein
MDISAGVTSPLNEAFTDALTQKDLVFNLFHKRSGSDFSSLRTDRQDCPILLELHYLLKYRKQALSCQVTNDLARLIATRAPLILAVVKEQLRILADASPITSDVFERIEALRESVYQSANYLEGIHAF